jgi:hypothetical protein
MALLIYSPKCSHCKEIVEYVHKHPQLKELVKYHNVNAQGIPPQYRNRVNRVPTMLTKNGKFLVGGEIRNWLQSLLPNTELEDCKVGGWGCSFSSLNDDTSERDMFLIDSYGQQLAPPMTPELQAKISKDVGQVAYEDIKN